MTQVIRTINLGGVNGYLVNTEVQSSIRRRSHENQPAGY
jgi:hypothetical protein